MKCEKKVLRMRSENLLSYSTKLESSDILPALYDSYAKAYRKLKDYQNEILICEEGISRFLEEQNRAQLNPSSCDQAISELSARRNKAIQLLYKQQNPKQTLRRNTLCHQALISCKISGRSLAKIANLAESYLYFIPMLPFTKWDSLQSN